jgi:hypothetical protein
MSGMDKNTRVQLDNLHVEDKIVRYNAFTYIIKATNNPVDWAYEDWDRLLDQLRDKDNHQRAIAAQVLANLAKSDPKGRMLKDIDTLLEVTKDERFVTARHSLQSMWKVAAAGKKLRKIVVDRLAERFKVCISEKNCTLIRYDIIQVYRRLYDKVKDEKVKQRALELIETEKDVKYRKKYAGLWRNA